MSVTVFVPKLAEDTSGGVVAVWYVEDGETVSAGQPIFCLERDFIAFDVEAEQDGILHHRAKVGDFFFAGAIVAAIEETEPAPVSEVPYFGETPDIAATDEDATVAEISYFDGPTDIEESGEASSLPEPIPFPAVDEAFDTGDAPEPVAWGHESSIDDIPEPVAWDEAEEVKESTEWPMKPQAEDDSRPAVWDEETQAEAAPEPIAWDAEPEAEDVPEPIAWDAEPEAEAVPEPVALYPEDEPVPDSHPMWDEAIQASTESEMEGTWGSFEEAIAAAEVEEPAAENDSEPGFSTVSSSPEEDEPAIASSWDEPAAEIDDPAPASEIEEGPASDSYAWMNEDTEEEPSPEPVFEANEPYEAEAFEQPEPAFEAIDDEESIPDQTFESFDAPAAEETFEPVAEFEAPPAEEFAPEAEPVPVASAEEPEPDPIEEVVGDSYEVEPTPAAVVMHMAIDLEVAPDFIEDGRAFTTALATAVELVVGETWEDYEPATSLVDSDSTTDPRPEDIVVYDFASFGIERAEAPLNGDAPVAFAIGKTLEHVSFSGQAIGVSHRASFSMSYDVARVNELEAARFLARVRDVVESNDQSVAA